MIKSKYFNELRKIGNETDNDNLRHEAASAFIDAEYGRYSEKDVQKAICRLENKLQKEKIRKEQEVQKPEKKKPKSIKRKK